MANDPTELMLNDAAYDALLNDAKVDNRVGAHEAMVAKVVHDKWPSGDDRTKIDFVLLTANNAKADLTWSVPPPPEVVVAEKATWPPEKVKGVASAITIGRQLAQHYGKRPDQVVQGERFNVQTVKTRRDDNTGKGGFIRVVAFLAKDHAVGAEAAAAAAAPAEAPAF